MELVVRLSLIFLLLFCLYNSQLSSSEEATCTLNDGTCDDTNQNTRRFRRTLSTNDNNSNDSDNIDRPIDIESFNLAKSEQDESINSREIKVLFQNKSGRKVKLYWKGPNEVILQSELDSPAEIIINSYIGHEFFFADYNDETKHLYDVIMTRHVEIYTLLRPSEMAKRDAQFEEDRRIFFQEYYKKTGRKWKNYWPRNPVESFMYNITHSGQIFNTDSNHTKYRQCPNYFKDDTLFLSLLNELSEEELEYKIEFDKNATIRKNDLQNKILREKEERELVRKHMIETGEINTKYFDSDGNERATGVDRDWFHHIPVYKSFKREYKDPITSNIYQILRYNGSIYCNNYNETQTNELIVKCTKPRLTRIFDFISDEECDHVIEIGNYLGLKRSTVSEAALKSQDRTSSTVWVERKFSPIIDNIIKRIGDVLHIDHNRLYLNASSESLQLVHYLGGELYKPHVDYGTDAPNNRFITFLMYLNDVEEGGNTSFPNADPACKGDSNYFGVHPSKGSVAWFYDLFPDGNVDDSTLHYAEPPGKGFEKWMTNLWIWDPYFK